MLEPNRTKNQITNTKKKSIPVTDLNKRTKDRFATKALTLLPSSFSFQAHRPLHSLGRGIFVYLLSNPKPYSIVPNTGNRPDCMTPYSSVYWVSFYLLINYLVLYISLRWSGEALKRFSLGYRGFKEKCNWLIWMIVCFH